MDAALKWFFDKLQKYGGEDWDHLMKARWSIFWIVLICLTLGVLIGRTWAAYLHVDSGLWRESNYTLRERTIEFTSRLGEFAANQTLEEGRPTASSDIAATSMRFRAQYAKDYRAEAYEFREALQARVCRDYKPIELTLDTEYDGGDSAYGVTADLERMANDSCWYRSIFPRIEASIIP
jgi:hypothetical protein